MSKIDEYTRVLRNQNYGVPCPHCTARSGHYSSCILLAPGASDGEYLSPLDDQSFLQHCGIQMEEL